MLSIVCVDILGFLLLSYILIKQKFVGPMFVWCVQGETREQMIGDVLKSSVDMLPLRVGRQNDDGFVARDPSKIDEV